MVTESPDVLESFLASFGDSNRVRNEIVDYWEQPDASPFPIAIYNHLVALRTIAPGETVSAIKYIPPERVHYLKNYFAESFVPDPVTGYAPKHRAPLIKALASLYAETHPQRAIYRVEADIMNLGGLNKAIMQARGYEDKPLADAVIRVLTNILRTHLEPLGMIAPIRHGGDELSIYVVPKNDFDNGEMERAIAAAQTEMVAFIKKAGLRDVAHIKKGKNPGVGIGCGITRLLDDAEKLKSDVALSVDLEAQIHDAKDAFQQELGEKGAAKVSLNGEALINLTDLESALSDARYSQYCSSPAAPSLPARGIDQHQLVPEEARLKRLINAIGLKEKNDISQELLRLAKGTAVITSKFDNVTDLPEFGSIEQRIVPDFCARFGNAARVVHLDFNNMGGGNKLGSWVGDAMARVFTECVKIGMEQQKLDQFIPYLTSQGGGKFTLLLPADVCTDKAVEQLTTAIEKQLVARSKVKLFSLDSSDEKVKAQAIEQAAATQPLLDKVNKEALVRRAGGYHEGDPHRPIQPDAKELKIGDISNTKSRRHGSHLVTLSPVIDLSKDSVIEVVGKLEQMARKGQGAIEDFDHRRAEKKRLNSNVTQAPQSTVEKRTMVIDKVSVSHPKHGLMHLLPPTR